MHFQMIDVNNDLKRKKALDIYTSNKEYFLMATNTVPNEDTLMHDMSVRPANTLREQKNFKLLGFDSNYVGIVDYITDYPDEDTVMIGLLMIHKSCQNEKKGSEIILELHRYFKDLGYLKVRVAVIEKNIKALRFWKTIGYEVVEVKTSIIADVTTHNVTVLEKRL